ncbi:unnamed protein product [Adineta ricciae]|uniref:Replication protein A OB domain-containing protein n=1 Tax=Adineta ricciae TaxID=249248 RepID=A0A815RAB2_ADIRI|nr:unnamed protein product [Adineta ricciae]CAF1638279.1 unnamed protein product [Adineta ricciae]
MNFDLIYFGFSWKLRAIVHFKHPKKTFTNATGVGEVTTWDLVDDTGSINLVAFNIQSNMMTNTLIIGKCYEMSHLSIKTVDHVYKTLSNDVQLVATSRTYAHEVVSNFTYEPVANFVTLQEIESLPLNSIVDVNIQVLRDYGTTTGFSNNYSWSRREIHVGQNGVAIRMTLWNDQAKQVSSSMVNLRIKCKNVKISWFNGSRTLISLPNSQLIISQ